MTSVEENDPDFTRRASRSRQSNDEIFLKYFEENDICLSPEGVLKCISVIACVISSVLFVWGGSCARAPALVPSAAAAALTAGGAVALLGAARALHAHACLYLDIIVQAVAGAALLALGVLSLTICELRSAIDYLHGPLAIAIAGMLVASAALAYSSATRLWDAAAAPAAEPRRPPPHELEV